MRIPVNIPYYISSAYGEYREYTYNGELYKNYHDGIDFINNNNDTRVYPVLRGKIITAEWHDTTGYYIIIQHDINGVRYYSKYAHLEPIHVKVGDKVDVNQSIGNYALVGKTTGLHVHVSVYNRHWKHFDFESWLNEKYTEGI